MDAGAAATCPTTKESRMAWIFTASVVSSKSIFYFLCGECVTRRDACGRFALDMMATLFAGRVWWSSPKCAATRIGCVLLFGWRGAAWESRESFRNV